MSGINVEGTPITPAPLTFPAGLGPAFGISSPFELANAETIPGGARGGKNPYISVPYVISAIVPFFLFLFHANINSTLALFGTLDQAIAEKAGNMNKPMPICCEFIVTHLLFLGPTIVYW